MYINQVTKNFLSDIGWSEGHRSDASPYIEALVGDGYSNFPASTDFLESFGGLRGPVPAYRVAGQFDQIHFDPRLAIENIYKERVEVYEKRVGEKLVVVGEIYNGNMALLISESGAFYGARDDYLCWIGGSAAEALNNIFDLRQFREITRE